MVGRMDKNSSAGALAELQLAIPSHIRQLGIRAHSPVVALPSVDAEAICPTWMARAAFQSVCCRAQVGIWAALQRSHHGRRVGSKVLRVSIQSECLEEWGEAGDPSAGQGLGQGLPTIAVMGLWGYSACSRRWPVKAAGCFVWWALKS